MKTKVTDQERILNSPRGEVWAEFFRDRNNGNFEYEPGYLFANVLVLQRSLIYAIQLITP